MTTIATYNSQVAEWARLTAKPPNVDDFVLYDDRKISWSRDLKADLRRGKNAEFSESKLRRSIYRPFARMYILFDRVMNEEVYVFPSIFPDHASEGPGSDPRRAQPHVENKAICLTDLGSEKPFLVIVADAIADLHLVGAGSSTQCFAFYTYDEDGTSRRENITDWSLEQFREHYKDRSISKWDIFHYAYAVLHHPEYRERYAANLRRDLPRIPFSPDFHEFSRTGAHLIDLHINYERQPEYPLERIENPRERLNWRVEKMKLSRDKNLIVYNDFLTLSGIPPEAFEYRLGNRSAIDWVVDQYQVSTDKRSGIINDPNRVDDPEYIVRLIAQVITVSLETMRTVKALPPIC